MITDSNNRQGATTKFHFITMCYVDNLQTICSDNALGLRFDVCLLNQLSGLRISVVSLLEGKHNKHFR